MILQRLSAIPQIIFATFSACITICLWESIYAGGGFSKQQPGLGTENRLGMPRQCMVLRQQLDLPKPLRRNLVFLPVN